ncbi:MAG: gliding motility lipoprotein GldH [Bacteroidota bacterium]
MNNRVAALVIAIGASLVACDAERVYETNTEVPEGAWEASEPVSFSVPIVDTLRAHNLFINVRNTADYPYRNLIVFVQREAPSGALERDTIECMLADSRGKWIGSGLGDIASLSIWFDRGVRFRESGTYTYTFEHAMRDQSLPGIIDVGLRVARSE